MKQDLFELYEKGKVAYQEYLQKKEQAANDYARQEKERIAREQSIIRDALVPFIGSLVEFVDLENKGFRDFGWAQGRGNGWYVTVDLPSTAPIRLRVFCTDETAEIARLDGNPIRGNVYSSNKSIFAVGNRAEVKTFEGESYLYWYHDIHDVDTTFTDLYMAVGCALVNANLGKEAWERWAASPVERLDKPEQPKTWKDTLAEAIEQAVQEQLQYHEI